jgi:hypothetical protein
VLTAFCKTIKKNTFVFSQRHSIPGFHKRYSIAFLPFLNFAAGQTGLADFASYVATLIVIEKPPARRDKAAAFVVSEAEVAVGPAVHSADAQPGICLQVGGVKKTFRIRKNSGTEGALLHY